MTANDQRNKLTVEEKLSGAVFPGQQDQQRPSSKGKFYLKDGELKPENDQDSAHQRRLNIPLQNVLIYNICPQTANVFFDLLPQLLIARPEIPIQFLSYVRSWRIKTRTMTTGFRYAYRTTAHSMTCNAGLLFENDSDVGKLITSNQMFISMNSADEWLELELWIA